MNQEHKNKIGEANKIALKKFYKTEEGKKQAKKQSERQKGKKLSEITKRKIKEKSIFKKGSKNPAWKGDDVSYYALHIWMKKHFGRANKCRNRNKQILNFKCSGISNNFQWARIKGHRYSRNKKDYYQLCISCHSKYDAP